MGAMELERAGWPDPMTMTPGMVLFRQRVHQEAQVAEFKASAKASRLSQADLKLFKEAMNS